MASKLDIFKRMAVLVRDGGCCVYCGDSYQHGAALTVDHVVSRKRGGTDAYTNLVTACRPCNEDKAHFYLDAYLLDLRLRGLDTEGIAERVEAARHKPIDWAAVEAAMAELKARSVPIAGDVDE